LRAAATIASWAITIWSISSSRAAAAANSDAGDKALALGNLRLRFCLTAGSEGVSVAFEVSGTAHVSPGVMNPG
jgi:hypothetical protein